MIPQIEGTVPIRSPAPLFVRAFRQRVAAGLLTGHPHPRSNYVVTEAGSDSLRLHAAGWWTALNVGLNELELSLRDGIVYYRVRYWRWAFYALGLCGGLGLIGVVVLLAFDIRGYIARHPTSQVPGLSIDQTLLIPWSMVVFWGFVWPWLLIALHKRPLRRLVARLVGEVDAEANPS